MVRIQAVGQKDEVGDGISFTSGDGIYKSQMEQEDANLTR